MSASSNAINKETFEELTRKLDKMGFEVKGIYEVNDDNYIGSFKISKNCDENHDKKRKIEAEIFEELLKEGFDITQGPFNNVGKTIDLEYKFKRTSAAENLLEKSGDRKPTKEIWMSTPILKKMLEKMGYKVICATFSNGEGEFTVTEMDNTNNKKEYTRAQTEIFVKFLRIGLDTTIETNMNRDIDFTVKLKRSPTPNINSPLYFHFFGNTETNTTDYEKTSSYSPHA